MLRFTTRSASRFIFDSSATGPSPHVGVTVHNARVITFNEENFDEEINQRRGPILIDFWASWCGPCKVVAPVLDRVAEELAGRAHVGKVNVDDNGDLTNRFGIRSIPTLVVFKDGKVVDQLIGAAPAAQIRGLVERHID